jgi:hypothetical protein
MTGSLIAGNTVLGDVLLMHKYYAKFNRFAPPHHARIRTHAT